MEKNSTNPFKCIIKLSTGKKQIEPHSPNKPKKGFITPIKTRNRSKRNNIQLSTQYTSKLNGFEGVYDDIGVYDVVESVQGIIAI